MLDISQYYPCILVWVLLLPSFTGFLFQLVMEYCLGSASDIVEGEAFHLANLGGRLNLEV